MKLDRRVLALLAALAITSWGAGAYTVILASRGDGGSQSANHTNCGLQQELAKQALCAEIDSASTARRANLIAVARILLSAAVVASTGYQLYLSRKAIDRTVEANLELIRQNEIAREVNRPWVDITFKVSRFFTRTDKIAIIFDVTFKNYGSVRTPCMVSDYNAVIYPPGDNEVLSAALRRLEPVGYSEGFEALAPGEEKTLQNVAVSFDVKDIPWKALGSGSEEVVRLCLVGVAYYYSPGFKNLSQVHRVQRAFLVGFTDGSFHPPKYLVRKDMHDDDGSNIGLTPDTFFPRSV